MNNNRKRYIAFFANLAANFAIGTAFVWSVFSKPLGAEFGWTDTQISFAFTITNLMFPLGMILSGQLQHRFCRRNLILAGGLLAGIGAYAAGYTNSLLWLYSSYGIISTAGLSMVYSCTMTNVIHLFPGKKGLTGGLLSTAYGVSAVIIAPVLQMIIAATSPLAGFKCLGIWYIAVTGLCWIVMALDHDDKIEKEGLFAREGTDSLADSPAPASNQLQSPSLFRNPRLYLVISIITIFALATLMIISQASVMAQTITGVSAATAALFVSFIAIGNTSGRLIWGGISDKLGRYNTLLVLLAIMMIAMFLLSKVSTGDDTAFAIFVTTVGFCYGGLMGILPALSADAFGAGDVGRNCGFLFLGNAAGGFIGAPLAASFADAGTGPDVYSIPFLLSSGFCMLGIVLVLALKKIKKK